MQALNDKHKILSLKKLTIQVRPQVKLKNKGKFSSERRFSALPIEIIMEKFMINKNLFFFLAIVIWLNQLPLLAQTPGTGSVSFTNKCFQNKCFERPNDLAIASDGSFFLVVDSSANPHVRKIEYSNEIFADKAITNLNQTLPKDVNLNIILSKNKKRAIVYRNNENTLVQILDVDNNSVLKNLNSVSSSTPVSSVDFLDEEGKKLIAVTANNKKSELLIINIDSDSIEKRKDLIGPANQIFSSNAYNKALITYKDVFAQSISLYDFANDDLKRYDAPPDLFFDILDILGSRNFDLKGKASCLSSFGGKFIFHLFDLKNTQLVMKQLEPNSASSTGPCISKISADNELAVSACSFFPQTDKFVLYKLDTSNKTNPSTVKQTTVSGISLLTDIEISPDQKLIYASVIKGGKRKFKIFDAGNLQELNELTLSDDDVGGGIEVEPYGRYVLSPNVKEVTVISGREALSGKSKDKK